MTTAGFDTLRVAKTLIAAGVEPRQAEAHAETIRDAVTEGIATKADVTALKTSAAATTTDIATLKTDVAALKADFAALRTDIAALENRMLKFGFGLAAGIVAMQTALTVGLLRLLG